MAAFQNPLHTQSVNPRRVALLEILGFYAAVLSVIWVGQLLSFRPPSALAGILLLAACLYSTRKHKDTLESIGLARKHFLPCLKLCLLWTGVPLLALLVWAGTRPIPSIERMLFGAKGLSTPWNDLPLPFLLLIGLARYPLWALAQEYALLSFLANRWKEAVGPKPWTVAFLNGLLFALAHSPNPLLMTVCFVSGVVFTRIFLKTPHIVPLAIAHAVAGLCLSLIFQHYYPAMMVGPAYLKWYRITEGGFFP